MKKPWSPGGKRPGLLTTEWRGVGGWGCHSAWDKPRGRSAVPRRHRNIPEHGGSPCPRQWGRERKPRDDGENTGEAIKKEGMAALGKVVFTWRAHIIALEARARV